MVRPVANGVAGVGVDEFLGAEYLGRAPGIVKILDPQADLVHEPIFQAATTDKTRFAYKDGVAVADERRNTQRAELVYDTTPPGGHERQPGAALAHGNAKTSAGGEQPIELAGVGQERVGRDDSGVVESFAGVHFDAEHHDAGPPVVSNLPAEDRTVLFHAAGIDRAARSAAGVVDARKPAPRAAAMDADPEARPLIDRRHHRGRRLLRHIRRLDRRRQGNQGRGREHDLFHDSPPWGSASPISQQGNLPEASPGVCDAQTTDHRNRLLNSAYSVGRTAGFVQAQRYLPA